MATSWINLIPLYQRHPRTAGAGPDIFFVALQLQKKSATALSRSLPPPRCLRFQQNQLFQEIARIITAWPTLQRLQENPRTDSPAVSRPISVDLKHLASFETDPSNEIENKHMLTINRKTFRWIGWQAAIAASCSLLPLHGFPPAPFHTIYGDVRDEQGVLISASGAAVVMSQGGIQRMREPLMAMQGADFNYQIRMRIDMGRSLTASYSSLVVSTASNYSLAIDIGGVLYHPIEITATPPTVGAPADRVRLNLTLGVDSDGDGLPDAWEESQLYQAGHLPGDDGWDLSLLDRGGDFDKDGLSNWLEYLAGTYAGDASSTIRLEIKEKAGENVRLETYAIFGKSYTIESSTDLKTWVVEPFSLTDPAAEVPAVFQASLISPVTGITSLYAKGTETTTYYRLNIR